MTTHTPTPDTDLWALAGLLFEAYEAARPGDKLFAAAKRADAWARKRYGAAIKEAKHQHQQACAEKVRRVAAEMERDNWRSSYDSAMKLLHGDTETNALRDERDSARQRAADLADRLMVVEAERDKLRKRVKYLDPWHRDCEAGPGLKVEIRTRTDHATIHRESDSTLLAGPFSLENPYQSRKAALQYAKRQGWEVVAYA